jgi:hypothetical protein
MGKYGEIIMAAHWIKEKCCYYCEHFYEPYRADLGVRAECMIDQEDDPNPVMVCDKFEPNLIYEQIAVT